MTISPAGRRASTSIIQLLPRSFVPPKKEHSSVDFAARALSQPCDRQMKRLQRPAGLSRLGTGVAEIGTGADVLEIQPFAREASNARISSPVKVSAGFAVGIPSAMAWNRYNVPSRISCRTLSGVAGAA